MPHSLAAKNGLLAVAHGSSVLLYKNSEKVKEVTLPEPKSNDTDINYAEQLQFSPDGKFLARVEHFTKSLVVSDINSDEEWSRTFPKRPSAFTFAEPSDLLVGDKFGDVYQLPIEGKDKPTGEPILGHVSMLLNIASIDNKIITSDRDEHIRVSRLDKPYVIEQFLFGHDQYVSVLTLVGGKYLISGGGDDFLLVWDINTGKKLSKFEVKPHVEELEEINVSYVVEYGTDEVLIVVENSTRILRAKVGEELEVVETIEAGEPVTSLAVSNNEIYVGFAQKLSVFEVGQPLREFEQFPESKVPTLAQHQLRKQPEF